MPPRDLFLPFLVAATLIELTPGPNMTYLAILSARHGRRAGFAAVAGIGIGLLVAGIAVALGLGVSLQAWPALYEAMRWAGIVYLLWLAWEGWKGEESSPAQVGPQALSARVHFRRGLITNLLNPKAYFFYIAVLPRFVAGELPFTRQVLVLSCSYVVVATAIHTLIAFLAGSVRDTLSRSRWATLVRRVLAILLALVAVWLAFETRR